MLVPRFEGGSLEACIEALGPLRNTSYVVGNPDDLSVVWPFDTQPGGFGATINQAMQADFTGHDLQEAFLLESRSGGLAQKTRGLNINELVLFCGIVHYDLGDLHPSVVEGMARYSSDRISERLSTLHIMDSYLRKMIPRS